MYSVYHTEAVVLEQYPVGERDIIFLIFTRELGLVYAKAHGIRSMHSKLRSILVPFSHASIDLVRGKEAWRIGSCRFISSYKDILLPVHHGVSIGILISEIKRLLVVEEPHIDLWNDVLSFLGTARTVSSEMLPLYIAVVRLRLLFRLGYVRVTEEMKHMLTTPNVIDAYTDTPTMKIMNQLSFTAFDVSHM